MKSFYQVLDAEMQQKVLLMAVQFMDLLPNIGEEVEINGKSLFVVHVKHVVNVSMMQSSYEAYLATKDLYDEIMKEEIEVHYDYDDDQE